MKGLVVAMDTAIVTTWFFSVYFVKTFPTSLATYVPIVLLVGYLAVLWLIYPRARLRLRFDQATIVALVAGAAYAAIIYEPLLIVHSILLPVSITSVAVILAYSALLGVFFQSFLFNVNMRSLFDRRHPGAVALPFVLYLILLVPLGTLEAYAVASPQQILTFVIIDLFGGAALFVVLLILYAKAKFNNLPGILFYLIAAIPNALSFLLAASPVLELVWLFAAFGVVIVLVEFALPSTWTERRLFPATQRPASPSSNRATLATVGAIGAVAVVIFLVLPAVLGTPHPFFADATGSMAPQIEPGSLLIVRHVNLDSIGVGEVLVFNAPWSPGLTVAHQVIAVLHLSSGLEFRTKGIANPVPDPAPVPSADVIGIVALVIPLVGYLVLDLYIVIIVTAVAVGAYIAYAMAYPRRPRFRHHRATIF
ncbi:MAG TPA: signal peptidase I [Thermoplasmata archaeon]|nr:signal peptidase I [Thermoplasmata archaeon]